MKQARVTISNGCIRRKFLLYSSKLKEYFGKGGGWAWDYQIQRVVTPYPSPPKNIHTYIHPLILQGLVDQLVYVETSLSDTYE